MYDGQALHLTRVRLGALLAQARAGGQVTAYQACRAIEPMVDVLLQIAREEGRWQAARSAAIAAEASAEAEASLGHGPGAWQPAEQLPRSSDRPSALPARRPPTSRRSAPGQASSRRGGRGPGATSPASRRAETVESRPGVA